MLVALVLAAGVVLRLHVASGLWLDEALSVDIARLPFRDLPEALRRDGSPPLYYALLHMWIWLFGAGGTAVRLLSGLFSLASLPLALAVGTRLRDRTTGWCAALLLASSPFAVHYAGEARMYSLVVLLALALVLFVLRAAEEPTLRRLAPVSLVSAALAYTHYWTFFLLAAAAIVLLRRWQAGSPDAKRCLAAMAAGGVLLLPWLPTLLFQLRHTGTPWAARPSLSAPLDVVTEWAGGSGGSGSVLALLLLALVLTGALGRETRSPQGRPGLLLSLSPDPVGRDLLVVAAGTLLLGVGAAYVSSSGFAARYSSAALAPALLLAALGLRALPVRARHLMLGLALVTGLVGSVTSQYFRPRTQAPVVAARIASAARAGDLVVYCPDQLGPAVSRLLPRSIRQVAYPTFGPARRVDWVDYAQRNQKASPQPFADLIAQRGPGAVFLVAYPGYRTFGHQCEQLDGLLTGARGGREVLLAPDRHFLEKAFVVRFEPLHR